jgi:hypothetical protein
VKSIGSSTAYPANVSAIAASIDDRARPCHARAPCWLASGAGAAAAQQSLSERGRRREVVYRFQAPPKTLDPQIAYTTTDHILTGNIFDTLLEYHYLDRPYRLIRARRGGAARRAAPGRAARLSLPAAPDALYQDDPAFALGGAGRTTRAVEAADVASR